MSTEKAIPPRWILSGSVLTAGFFLTGAGTIMLGVLLPVLSQKWGFRDDKAGFLLFLQFLGSTLGAILTGTDRSRSLKAGYGLLVLSAGTLAFAGQHTLFACFFVFGVGLGLVMTSTSLLFSDRYQNDRAIQLERLNFAWSAGAMIIPVLLLPFLRGANLRILFFTIGGLFLLLFLWVLVREPREWPYLIESAGSELDNPAVVERYLPLVLVVMCAVGVETALSGWLTTYSHRADPHGSGKEAFAIALFMFGIVLSRLGFSTSLLKVIGRQRAIFGSLWGTAVSVALLIAGHHTVLIDLAAGLCGLSIGPLYPLLLSFLLERFPRGWIFAMAGIGSAAFPWLTGMLSAQLGSLRFGLLAPGGAALLMIVLSFVSLRSVNRSGLPAPSRP